MINEWDITETNQHRLAQRRYEVAVLPVGAIEAHNRHLPEGLDFGHTTHIARHCCAAAWAQEPTVLCLPTIPYGVDCNLMSFPLSIHVSQSTLDMMVSEIVRSLRHHDIQKIVILNGHGGNEFSPLIRQLQCDLDVHLFLCNWWTVGRDKYDSIFNNPDDHAGEMETSVALSLCPDLVEMEVAGDGEVRPFRFEALEKGWVRTSRDFSRLNSDCGAGNPLEASAEKGKEYLDLVCERITAFLVELARATIDSTFPHVEQD